MIITEGRRKKEEGRRKKEEGRRKKEEGRRKKEEGRRKKEEGRRKKEEGRRKQIRHYNTIEFMLWPLLYQRPQHNSFQLARYYF
ncbi:hypothetical protein BCD67_14170 [Oscillatoriales cyanobacterium USR001]|nr:hypothetical protein BCD67_14170 [Oscillatoriales cyanobacterium USR001]